MDEKDHPIRNEMLDIVHSASHSQLLDMLMRIDARLKRLESAYNKRRILELKIDIENAREKLLDDFAKDFRFPEGENKGCSVSYVEIFHAKMEEAYKISEALTKSLDACTTQEEIDAWIIANKI